MFKHTGGETVKGGFYWNSGTWRLEAAMMRGSVCIDFSVRSPNVIVSSGSL